MEENQPSRTAQGAAMHRAVHQLVDRPPVFADPLAVKIIGKDAATDLCANTEEAASRSPALRAFIAARSRFSEDCLGEAMRRGVRQYVLLGAGLDTLAYRAAREGLRTFEIDHPATQGWKRQRLEEVEIAIPDHLTFAAVDFERELLGEGLARAGFDFSQACVFAWLGVTPYLTADAVMATLAYIAALAAGSELIFDYAEASGEYDAAQQETFKALAERVAAAGEPIRSTFEPQMLAREIKRLGYSFVEDLDTQALNARYFRGRSDGLLLRGRAHIVRARV